MDGRLRYEICYEKYEKRSIEKRNLCLWMEFMPMNRVYIYVYRTPERTRLSVSGVISR